MTWDTLWQIIRYLLIAGGGYLASKGVVTEDQVQTAVGAIGSLGAMIWGFYVKHGTTAVPNATANRVDVPTVSGLTGVTTK